MKKLYILFLALVVFISFGTSTSIYAKDELDIQAKYAYVRDSVENREYYSKKGNDKIYPASMTKIVTCIVALEAIDDLSESVQIEEDDIEGLLEENASVAGFMSGEEVTYEDLLYGSLLPSGADASKALARLTYGSESAFVKKMNELCTSLNLKNTHFVNPTGLHDDDHYTTCKEMAALLQYAYQNKNFQTIYGSKEYTSSNALHTWQNTLYAISLEENLSYDYILGAKTGYTEEAKRCVASGISSKGHKVISILAYDEEKKNLLEDLELIQAYLNKSYEMVSLDSVFTEKRFRNHLRKVSVYREKERELYLPKDYDKESLTYTFDYTVKKTPIEANSVVGTYTILYKDDVIETGNLIVKETVKRNVVWIVIKTVIGLCIGLFIFMCALRYRNIKRRKKRKNG